MLTQPDLLSLWRQSSVHVSEEGRMWETGEETTPRTQLFFPAGLPAALSCNDRRNLPGSSSLLFGAMVSFSFFSWNFFFNTHDKVDTRGCLQEQTHLSSHADRLLETFGICRKVCYSVLSSTSSRYQEKGRDIMLPSLLCLGEVRRASFLPRKCIQRLFPGDLNTRNHMRVMEMKSSKSEFLWESMFLNIGDIILFHFVPLAHSGVSLVP